WDRMGAMYTAGIDIGALTAKSVILEDGEILAYTIIPSGSNSKETAQRVMEATLSEAGLSQDDVTFTVATGYGRVNVPFADKQVTEISCHAKGAYTLFPTVRTVIDIGGQDSKAIKVGKNGRVVEFAMNDRCAAGTGRFLEVMAKALEVRLEDLGELSLKSRNKARISSICTVFAESEVISRISEGTPKVDIIAGIHEAIANRIFGMASRVRIEKDLVLTGGVAKNRGVVKALEEKVGFKILVPKEPQIVGALGAAVIARENIEGGRNRGR
ncbi:MAG: acyl-CoA dehydratase activase, partial [Candidatus Freyarchaeota archaeon]